MKQTEDTIQWLLVDYEEKNLSRGSRKYGARTPLELIEEENPLSTSHRCCEPEPEEQLLLSTPLDFTVGILPSFITPSFTHRHSISCSRYKSPSYIDGLQGAAALILFISYQLTIRAPQNGQKYSPVIDEYHFDQLLSSGFAISSRLSVSLFFILSGFSLALRPIQLIRAGKTTAMLDDLSRTMFRRAFRFLFAVLGITALTSLCIWFGIYRRSPDLAQVHASQSTFNLQMGQWWNMILHAIRPYQYLNHIGASYNPYLNLVAFELFGSLTTFLFCLCLARVRSWIRIFCLIILIYYSMMIDQLNLGLFISSIVLAELSCIFEEPNATSRLFDFPVTLPQSLSERLAQKLMVSSHVSEFLRRFFWSSVLVVSLHLHFCDSGLIHETHGLEQRVPRVHNLEDFKVQRGNFWGSVLLVLALQNCSVLQWPFKTDVAQYLGKVSYALYVVHVPLALVIAGPLIGAFMEMIGDVPGLVVGTAIDIFLTLWGADLFWRGVEMHGLRSGGWIYGKCRMRI